MNTDNWTAVRRGTAEGAEIKVDGSKLPTVKNDADEEILKFFWLDAFEADNHKSGKLQPVASTRPSLNCGNQIALSLTHTHNHTHAHTRTHIHSRTCTHPIQNRTTR